MTQGPRVCVVLAAVVLTSASYADTPADNRKADDKALFGSLREVINRGVDLYNAGDTTACYRLYEGSLMTIRPLLEHKPDLQKTIAQSLAAAERDPVAWRRAFTLRNALDKVRAGLKTKKRLEVNGPAPKEDNKKAPAKDSQTKPIDKDAEKLPLPRVEEEKQEDNESHSSIDFYGTRVAPRLTRALVKEAIGKRQEDVEASLTGKLRRTELHRVYRLESVRQGVFVPTTYVVPTSGVNLEPYIGRVVEVRGPGHYDGQLWANLLKVKQVFPQP
jgi:hypothetical protein